MRFFASKKLLWAFVVSAFPLFCHAFTISTFSKASINNANTHSAISSPLFNQYSNQCSGTTLISRLHPSSLGLSAGDDGATSDSEASTEEPSTDTTTSSGDADDTPKDKRKKERSGFVTALILAPPLIFKFAIVLIVKFLTDVVVFPFLILYRFVKLSKNKALAFFSSISNKKNINGDDVNGASSSSS